MTNVPKVVIYHQPDNITLDKILAFSPKHIEAEDDGTLSIVLETYPYTLTIARMCGKIGAKVILKDGTELDLTEL